MHHKHGQTYWQRCENLRKKFRKFRHYNISGIHQHQRPWFRKNQVKIYSTLDIAIHVHIVRHNLHFMIVLE
ncbi:hypothetical protein Mapa_018548 [Marchantia paleacea]|nr:hypothetical protein Mapa_018548 [Marchantia paleacea]